MCPTLSHDIPMIPHEYHIEFQKLNPNHHFLVKTPSSPTMYAETVGMGWMLAPVAAPELRPNIDAEYSELKTWYSSIATRCYMFKEVWSFDPCMMLL